MKYKFNILIAAFLFILLAGCGRLPEEKIQNILESARGQEAGYETEQKEIAQLEQEEQKLFDEIIEKTSEDLDEIEKIANEALKNIDQRSKKIGLEKDSIQKSREEFSTVEKQITKLSDAELEKKANELVRQMELRYGAYDDLYNSYETMLKSEKGFYQAMKNEQVQKAELEELLVELNKSYKDVLDKNDKFNKTSEKYNKIKTTFYEKAEL